MLQFKPVMAIASILVAGAAMTALPTTSEAGRVGGPLVKEVSIGKGKYEVFMMSLGNEQWMKNLNELWLDPNGIYHKFMEKQREGCFRSLRWAFLGMRMPVVTLSARKIE